MAGPLLETKLQVPRRRRDLVARPRLERAPEPWAESALTLASARPGSARPRCWRTGWQPRQLTGRPRLGFPRPARQRSRVVLDVPGRLPSDATCHGHPGPNVAANASS